MANTFREKDFLIPIMCSYLSQSAACFMHSGFLLHIISNYAFTILCGSPHKICNEEGKLDGLPLNRALRDEDGDIYDVVAGNFFLAGIGEDDFIDLPDELVEQFTEQFWQPEVFVNVGGRIIAYPVAEEPVQDGMSY